MSKVPSQSAIDWYQKKIKGLDLVVTDCPGIYHTTTGITACYYVQSPDNDWTQERAEEQIERIKAEMLKRGRIAKK